MTAGSNGSPSVRILLADDHRMIREALSKLLDSLPGVEVAGEAEDGRSAVALAAEVRPDVVVMDVDMPGLNGIEATRQITAARHWGDAGGDAEEDNRPAPKVIALSGHNDHKFAAEMLRAGAAGYVVKPQAAEELAGALHAVMAGGVYLSPAVSEAVVLEAVAGGAGEVATAFSKLSPREREVLQLIAEGQSTKEVAQTLQVSVKTVETHRRNMMEKLGTDSVAGLTRYAVREGITSLG